MPRSRLRGLSAARPRLVFGLAFAFALFLGLASPPLFAQSQATTGVISGFVSDPQGLALPGATVTVRNLNTNFEQTVNSDRD